MIPHLPFGFKLTIILGNAMICLDKTYFLQIPFRLFLLSFRTHPDCPHSPDTKPLSLQCYPQYLRFSDILSACSSSNPKVGAATEPKLVVQSLYTAFTVYLTTTGRQKRLNVAPIYWLLFCYLSYET